MKKQKTDDKYSLNEKIFVNGFINFRSILFLIKDMSAAVSGKFMNYKCDSSQIRVYNGRNKKCI